MKKKILVGIVDDNAVLSAQLKENLSVAEHIEIIFTASNGKEALDLISKLDKLPHVILMDIEMPVMNGVEATAAISRETLIKTLILTVFDTDEKLFDAIKAGAAGYLLKDSKPKSIIAAIEDVIQGGAPMSPIIAAKTLNLLRSKTTFPNEKKPQDYKLSERETEILKLLAEGFSYQQIADTLFISHGTVRKHVENIYNKLHINSKAEAILKVNRHKWFT